MYQFKRYTNYSYFPSFKSCKQQSCLDILAINGHTKPMKTILSQGKDFININRASSLGWTALHYACKYGQLEACNLLLDFEAEILVTNSAGQTPLHIAAMYGNEDCLRTLLYSDIDQIIVESRDRLGNFPLHYALGWRNPAHGGESFEHDPNSVMSVDILQKLIEIELAHGKGIHWIHRFSILQKNAYNVSPLDMVANNQVLRELLESYLPSFESKEIEYLNVQIVSDVHTEFMKEGDNLSDIIGKSDCKYLFLVGDIGIPSTPTFKEFIRIQSQRFEQVFFITGNHEYYGSEVNEVDQGLATFFNELGNVTHLKRGVNCILEGVRIVGCTLWTYIPDEVKDYIHYHLNDYRRITVKTDVCLL